MSTAVLTVDQSLVDAYLARVDRFVRNVEQFEQQIKDMTSAVKERLVPEQKAQTVYRESTAPKPTQDVVTADDIDIDALLSGVDLGDMTL